MRTRGAIPCLALFGFAVALMSIPATAFASSETEPNNTILTATGPIGAETYSGELQGSGDVDWYWMELGGQQQLTFTASTVETSECRNGPELAVVTNWSRALASLRPEGGAERQYRFSTPAGGGRYYVRVSSEYGTDCQYSFSIGPTSAFVPPPAALPVVEVPEPNEFPGQAYGPLKAGVLYSGKIETSNDLDWLYFEGRPNRRVTITPTVFGCEGGLLEATLLKEISEGAFHTIYAGGEYEGSGTGTVSIGPRPHTWYLQIEGDEGCSWQLEVSPLQSLLGPQGKAEGQSGCAGDKQALKRRRGELRRIEQRAVSARTAGQRNAVRRALASGRHRVKAARAEVRKECT
jgi:hypothetical protein